MPISDSLTLWNSVRRECGLDDVRPHDRRHTYGSQAVMPGVPLPVVVRHLCHSNVTMTLLYVHVAEKEVQVAAEWIGAKVSECLRLLDHRTRHLPIYPTRA